ncbi:hypothetical protein SAMN05421741_11360 [Paenimyroides ummariense]|uniref:Uncharacterized protein n=1 Tax=Paenimyroides ummariense TaxID=913024 RepID=A0A1I5CU79_9FLAO|nr:hypothetical protein [Paenimyroides ummariense]SFN90406.1 hypothetical protein SAMN05421741_11360 [Paenimyroides ummariense]
MNSQFIFQIKKIDDELHTIFTLKELNVSIETFFNELQKIKYHAKSNVKIDFTSKAGTDHYFNRKGILSYGTGHEVKVDYSWYDIKNKLCKDFMLFFITR